MINDEPCNSQLKKLYDNHGRVINYVRLAVTDRCNLRCFYCMPEEGIDYVPREELMHYEEMERLLRILAGLGIEKVRITGGEPFVRRDMMSFIRTIAGIAGIRQIHLTTNGTFSAPLVGELKEIGVRSVNLSLDTLDRQRFFNITRRDVFDQVMQTFEALMQHGIRTKINAVVMQDRNEADLIPLMELTRQYPVDVRFIEEMPFNGGDAHYEKLFWDHRRILDFIKTHYPEVQKIPDPPFSTSANYQIPGCQGNIGIIAAYSRTFCGTCNRIRVTPQGVLKTCLYDEGVFNLKTLMRSGASDEEVQTAILQALGNRAKDGFEAEQLRSFGHPVHESMSGIGG